MADRDCFGEAFLDYLEGRKVKLTIERDDGYRDEQGFDEYFADYDGFPSCEKKALKHAKGRVLDMGVGAGRISLHLQRKGLEVVGLDLSDLAIEVSRRRGVRNLVKMSICDLKYDAGCFDTVIAFGNNFGLCGTPERVMDMMSRLREIVSDDGVFLAESINPVDTKRPEHLEYHRRNIARGRPPGQVTLRFLYKGAADDWFELLMVTPEEMQALCSRTGWCISKSYRCKVPPYVVYVLTKA